jgi:hypothetical protein
MKKHESYQQYKDAYYRGLYALVDELEAEGPHGLQQKDGLYSAPSLDLSEMEIDGYEALVSDPAAWEKFAHSAIDVYLEATPTLSPFEADEKVDTRHKADTASMAGKHFRELTDIDNKFPGPGDTGYNDKNIRNLSTLTSRAHHFNLLEGYKRTEACIKARSSLYAIPALLWWFAAFIPGVAVLIYEPTFGFLSGPWGLVLLAITIGSAGVQLLLTRLRFNKLKETRDKWLHTFHNQARNQSQKVGHICSVRNERLSMLMETMLVRARRAKTRYLVGESTEIWMDEMDRWLRLVAFTQARIKNNRSFLRKKNWELRMIDRAVWARAQCQHHYTILSAPNIVMPRHLGGFTTKLALGGVLVAALVAFGFVGPVKFTDWTPNVMKAPETFLVWWLTLAAITASAINAYLDHKYRKEHDDMVDAVADEKLIRDMCEAITHNQPRGDIASRHTDLIAENARIMAEWLRDEERKNHR